MSSLLLTGATGTLGRAVDSLAVPGETRTLSRRAAPAGLAGASWAQGDLATGEGLDAALEGVDTIIHCATRPRGGDARMTRILVDAARRSTTPPHIVYVSIVGVDRIPLAYYREKLAAEDVVESSGLRFSIQRATQFHNLVFSVVASQRRMPLVLTPSIRVQPIDVHYVADQLLALARTGMAGRMPDIGGPQVVRASDLARATLKSLGTQRPVVPVLLPGAVFAAFRAGHNLAPGNRLGTRTYDDFLAGLPV
ncbi:hypothetical protein JF66_00445 [Cryobacterium sp. MLB-32]|uniref:SDR family oxidoreductase n=1 Tax=Cryobacterium sp. MLB-32 TaxID=1529318 RepID=UPI0004E705BC|nr:NAD(P)H-binding protein [Cryobacterium sp. MLB-32]KFF60987.1 hypothetical protein JF66_00445 [Cryobacterium sp. MLB-32]